MTPRDRYIKTLKFGDPDRIPFEPGGGRESTLKRWVTEGLPAGRDPTEHAMELLGIVPEPPKQPYVSIEHDFRLRPQFEEKVIEHKDGHYVVQDWKGNICEISDEYDVTYLRNATDFVTRRWIKCPVENRDDWEAIKERYDAGSPGRLSGDIAELALRAEDRDWILAMGVSGPFWQLREWCGFEGLCMMMLDDPDLVAEMAEFWKNFVNDMLDRILEHVVPDMMHISEDMAYKEKAMISMDMTREFCMPSWTEWCRKIYAAGCPIVDMDSDGYVGELIPLWIESGINVCDPIEVAAGCDINVFRKQFGHQIAYRQGVDKRCMAAGGQKLRDEMKRLEPCIRDGGYIPSCDHGIPADVSWDNFLDYCGQLARTTGWL